MSGVRVRLVGSGDTRVESAGDRSARHGIAQARIPAGSFSVGDAPGDENCGDGETPRHRVTLEGFEIDVTTVTNADFARFAEATGYRTEAETFGFSAVFPLAVSASDADIMGPAAGTPWWFGARGEEWAHPGGSRSDRDGLDGAKYPGVTRSPTTAVGAPASGRDPSRT